MREGRSNNRSTNKPVHEARTNNDIYPTGSFEAPRFVPPKTTAYMLVRIQSPTNTKPTGVVAGFRITLRAVWINSIRFPQGYTYHETSEFHLVDEYGNATFRLNPKVGCPTKDGDEVRLQCCRWDRAEVEEYFAGIIGSTARGLMMESPRSGVLVGQWSLSQEDGTVHLVHEAGNYFWWDILEASVDYADLC